MMLQRRKLIVVKFLLISCLLTAFFSLDARAYGQSDVLDSQYDIIVAGAGTSGVAAAIQAARMGAKVALLEETDWIGGQMTAAGVTSLDEGGSAEDRGIFKEFLQRLKQIYGAKPITTSYFNDNYSAEPGKAQQVLYDMINETKNRTIDDNQAILHLSLYTEVIEVQMSGNKVTGVKIKITEPGKTEVIKNISCKILIDATEYGDVLALTPARYRVGSSTSDNKNLKAGIQDITYLTVLKKYPQGVPASLEINSAWPEAQYSNELKSRFAKYVTNDLSARTYTECKDRNGDGWVNATTECYPNTPYTHCWACDYSGLWNSARWDWQLQPWCWQEFVSYRGMPNSDGPNALGGCANYTQISKTGINKESNDYPALTDKNFDNSAFDSVLTADYLENSEARKYVNCQAKQRTLQFLLYAKNELGSSNWGFSASEGYDTPYNSQNSCQNVPDEVEKYFAVMPYVRESRRLIGLHTLNGFEIQRYNGETNQVQEPPVKFETALSLADYHMDLHDLDDLPVSEREQDFETVYDPVEKKQRSEYDLMKNLGYKGHAPFQVPFESFIPETVDGLLAAEKNISQTRMVSGATRMQPSTMLIGQAAGTIAALSVEKNTQPREIDPILVQMRLVKDGSNLSIKEYSDIPKSHSLWPYVQLSVVRKIFEGYDDGTFRPGNEMTRAQAAVTFARNFKLATENPPASPTYSDVPSSFWAYKEIEATIKAGIMKGCNDANTNFCPSEKITRAQYSRMVVAALGVNVTLAENNPFFTDVPASHPDFKYIQILYQLGVTEGYQNSDGSRSYNPDEKVSRGQAAVFLVRSLVVQAEGIDEYIGVLGDLNADNFVNLFDIQLCAYVAAGTETNPGIISRADVNGDGQRNLFDIQQVANLAAAG